ncbi:DNA polymerase III subunit delta [Ferrimonas lipolytica]|uniref:DNA polymerase III subunit delta n=1 Tax=Ferrimonas lipolytica TaxID=2724191 RepID=A0A6H1UGY5_9GAMM|nr:DNA polymerase III subunit delta [Ferrimonas lipolytica]QIZ77583.1 DNA polymerase III subunit delta [Ferrimonas lipolytica]
MRIFASQLQRELTKLPQVMMVFGDDVLIREECRDTIREQLMKRQGIEERLSMVQESSFDWQGLLQECQALSLFASRRLIELELPTLKPGTEGAAALVELAANLAQQQDTFVLLHGPKAAREQTNSKWFKSLDKVGLHIQALTPEGSHYQRWIGERARRHKLNLSSSATQLIASMFEGNLMAADQTMAQLGLISDGQRIEQTELQELLEDQSRYTVFQLVDALLAGQIPMAIKMLNQLQLEDTAPTLIGWALSREFTTLCRLAKHLQEGQNRNAAMKTEKIWEKRQRLYGNCLDRITPAQLGAALAAVGQLEQLIKLEGGSDAQQWLALADLCARFDGNYQPLAIAAAGLTG